MALNRERSSPSGLRKRRSSVVALVAATSVAALTTAAAFVLSLGSRLTVGRWTWKAVPLPEAVAWIRNNQNRIEELFSDGAATASCEALTALEDANGEVADAFGQPGGGTQWVVVDNNGEIVLIHDLIEDGYLARG